MKKYLKNMLKIIIILSMVLEYALPVFSYANFNGNINNNSNVNNEIEDIENEENISEAYKKFNE